MRFFYSGGTTNEVFEEYISVLITTLRRRYPQVHLLIVLDNLAVILFSVIYNLGPQKLIGLKSDVAVEC